MATMHVPTVIKDLKLLHQSGDTSGIFAAKSHLPLQDIINTRKKILNVLHVIGITNSFALWRGTSFMNVVNLRKYNAQYWDVNIGQRWGTEWSAIAEWFIKLKSETTDIWSSCWDLIPMLLKAYFNNYFRHFVFLLILCCYSRPLKVSISQSYAKY